MKPRDFPKERAVLLPYLMSYRVYRSGHAVSPRQEPKYRITHTQVVQKQAQRGMACGWICADEWSEWALLMCGLLIHNEYKTIFLYSTQLSSVLAPLLWFSVSCWLLRIIITRAIDRDEEIHSERGMKAIPPVGCRFFLLLRSCAPWKHSNSSGAGPPTIIRHYKEWDTSSATGITHFFF